MNFLFNLLEIQIDLIMSSTIVTIIVLLILTKNTLNQEIENEDDENLEDYSEVYGNCFLIYFLNIKFNKKTIQIYSSCRYLC